MATVATLQPTSPSNISMNTVLVPEEKCITMCSTHLDKNRIDATTKEDVLAILSCNILVTKPEIQETETSWLIGEHKVVGVTSKFLYLAASICDYVEYWSLIKPTNGANHVNLRILLKDEEIVEITSADEQRTPITELVLENADTKRTVPLSPLQVLTSDMIAAGKTDAGPLAIQVPSANPVYVRYRYRKPTPKR